MVHSRFFNVEPDSLHMIHAGTDIGPSLPGRNPGNDCYYRFL